MPTSSLCLVSSYQLAHLRLTSALLSSTLLPLQQLHGKNVLFSDGYVLKEDIGMGSFSVCKRCVHKATNTEYAVKVHTQMHNNDSSDINLIMFYITSRKMLNYIK